jgi:hypothetical protein
MEEVKNNLSLYMEILDFNLTGICQILITLKTVEIGGKNVLFPNPNPYPLE